VGVDFTHVICADMLASWADETAVHVGDFSAVANNSGNKSHLFFVLFLLVEN